MATVTNCYPGSTPCCPPATATTTVTFESPACCTIAGASTAPICPTENETLSLNCISDLSSTQTVQWQYLVDAPCGSGGYQNATNGTAQNTNSPNFVGASTSVCWKAIVHSAICQNDTIGPIQINVSQLPGPFTISAAPMVLCPSGTTTITATAPSGTSPITYTLWKNGSAIQGPQASQVFNNIGPGVYWVVAKNNCGSKWSNVLVIKACKAMIVWKGDCCLSPGPNQLIQATLISDLSCGTPTNVSWTLVNGCSGTTPTGGSGSIASVTFPVSSVPAGSTCIITINFTYTLPGNTTPCQVSGSFVVKHCLY